MSSFDMSVEDHDHYSPDAEGIPERCWCGCQPVKEMHRDGVDAGRVAFKCTHKDAATLGGHLFRWFDTAVCYEFHKLKHEIPRVALLEDAHDLLKDEVRKLKEEMARERRQMGMLLVDVGVRLNHGVAI